jgi:preprotein translocase subunit SecD
MMPGQEKLSDGFYGILKEVSTTERFEPADQVTQLVTSDFGAYYVRKTPDVSLRLATEPETGKGNFELTGIDLMLVEDESRRLEQLTQANIGKRVLIIVEGVVVSAPEVRDTVTGPECQIHCINEDRRNDVLAWLMDNVAD